jgi:hypothetical protein
MSLATNITDLATRVATEAKALRTLINGNATDLSSLTTTAKTNLVAAINELDAAIGASGATDLDGLSDVTLTGPTTGHVLRHNGTVFVNVLGSTFFETAGAAATAQAAAIAASQPLDSDLTAIAALSTTAYGRALLTLADAAALTAAMNAATELVKGTVELATTAEVVTGTDTTRAVTPAGVAAAVSALVDAAPGTLNTLNELAAALGDDPNFATTISTSLAGKQPLDTDLTAIAALVSAADRVPYATGAGTWSLATFTAAGRALLDDADAAAQRTTLSVYSQAEIGDPTTNFVTAFNAGLV